MSQYGEYQKPHLLANVIDMRHCAYLCRMNMHDCLKNDLTVAHQFWWAFAYITQVHENHCVKRVGVAGLRARSSGLNP